MADTSILTREHIALQAKEAAREWVATPDAPKPVSPYPIGSDAHAAWRAAFERALLLVSCPECDGGA